MVGVGGRIRNQTHDPVNGALSLPTSYRKKLHGIGMAYVSSSSRRQCTIVNGVHFHVLSGKAFDALKLRARPAASGHFTPVSFSSSSSQRRGAVWKCERESRGFAHTKASEYKHPRLVCMASVSESDSNSEPDPMEVVERASQLLNEIMDEVSDTVWRFARLYHHCLLCYS